ncbi:hypothetical protein N3K66_005664 [Trichothecium roseum]|uniref:Uncharacterized protein n=1 Tax=Trichothecium roseum TaxID=47278 RepID=A0ACC0UYJ0_9HYPO|nr:hypothetical protein N3K66_005664 [Trichothecium roseum]
MDNYQRCVQWVLTNQPSKRQTARMVVLSPFEANALISEMASTTTTVLSLYAPRQNMAFAPIDHLNLYTIPHSVILYFASFAEYKDVCDYLGLAWKVDMEGVVVDGNGFILHRDPNMPHVLSGFEKSPVAFVRDILVKMRKNAEGIEKTHLGKLLNGTPLTEDEFSD